MRVNFYESRCTLPQLHRGVKGKSRLNVTNGIGYCKGCNKDQTNENKSGLNYAKVTTTRERDSRIERVDKNSRR